MRPTCKTHSIVIGRQVLSKQQEDDPWQELEPKDVSVVWYDDGFMYLRARIYHFTWFGLSRRPTSASENLVDSYWRKAVLVVNRTNSVVHVTPMPVSFTPTKETTKAVALTFCETTLSFEKGKKTEQLMLPANVSSEIIPVGGATTLFLSGGAKEMRIIVCFLPDRDKAAQPASIQATSPGSGNSGQGAASVQATPVAASTMQGATTQDSANAAPSSGVSAPLGGLLTPASILAAAIPQQDDGLKPPLETEEMIYSMTKVMPSRTRLTLRLESTNRKIKIERGARALETYAMMLADFGTNVE